MVTNQDKEEEEIYLNPNKIEEIQQKRAERKEQQRIELLDEEKITEVEKKRFDQRVYRMSDNKVIIDVERSMHPEIPPAKLRIQEFKRKDLNDKYQKTSSELRSGANSRRPMTGGVPHTQSLGSGPSQAELTTQAQSAAAFEETEKAYSELPFNKFFSTNENVVFKT